MLPTDLSGSCPEIMYYFKRTLMKHLKFTSMLAHSNYERLSARKANLSFSTVENFLMPNNDI